MLFRLSLFPYQTGITRKIALEASTSQIQTRGPVDTMPYSTVGSVQPRSLSLSEAFGQILASIAPPDGIFWM